VSAWTALDGVRQRLFDVIGRLEHMWMTVEVILIHKLVNTLWAVPTVTVKPIRLNAIPALDSDLGFEPVSRKRSIALKRSADGIPLVGADLNASASASE
jgi:hypothetical protein